MQALALLERYGLRGVSHSSVVQPLSITSRKCWSGDGVLLASQFYYVGGTVPLDICLPFFMFARGLRLCGWLCMCYRYVDSICCWLGLVLILGAALHSSDDFVVVSIWSFCWAVAWEFSGLGGSAVESSNAVGFAPLAALCHCGDPIVIEQR